MIADQTQHASGGPEPLLELSNVSKHFGGVMALQNVDFTLLPGEIHGLVGENGAGKSTTMKIIAAVNSPAVKINWDLYHMHITEGDLCGHLREGFQAGHIGYLQLADHPGRNEPGTGEIHYNRVLKAAHALGYRGETTSN